MLWKESGVYIYICLTQLCWDGFKSAQSSRVIVDSLKKRWSNVYTDFEWPSLLPSQVSFPTAPAHYLLFTVSSPICCLPPLWFPASLHFRSLVLFPFCFFLPATLSSCAFPFSVPISPTLLPSLLTPCQFCFFLIHLLRPPRFLPSEASVLTFCSLPNF